MMGQSELICALHYAEAGSGEPANQTFWMAEAENWSRLSKEKLHGEDGVEIDPEFWRGCARNRPDFCSSWRSKRRDSAVRPDILVSRAPVS